MSAHDEARFSPELGKTLGAAMSAHDKTLPADPANARLCEVMRECLARAESGETVGFIGWEVHADGTFTRAVLGTAREERFTLAGLALNLAMEVGRD